MFHVKHTYITKRQINKGLSIKGGGKGEEQRALFGELKRTALLLGGKG